MAKKSLIEALLESEISARHEMEQTTETLYRLLKQFADAYLNLRTFFREENSK